MPLSKETAYLDTYIRGVYAKRDLKPGELLREEDIYLAIPLQKGQISCRELMLGKFGHKLTKPVIADSAITIDDLDTPYSRSESLRRLISERGL
jgi:N-acetylneuraminate synthase